MGTAFSGRSINEKGSDCINRSPSLSLCRRLNVTAHSRHVRNALKGFLRAFCAAESGQSDIAFA